MSALFLVLFISSLSLTSLQHGLNGARSAIGSTSHEVITVGYSFGGYNVTTAPLLFDLQEDPPCVCISCPPTAELAISEPYSALMHMIWLKASGDILLAFSRAWEDCASFLAYGWAAFATGTLTLASNFLWFMIWLWGFVAYWITSCMWRMWRLILPVSLLASLGYFTLQLAKAIGWFFGPTWCVLTSCVCAIRKIFWRNQSSKANFCNEQRIEGFKSFSYYQEPKKCILEIEHDNGSAAGFASVIRLEDMGECALLTCAHCLGKGRRVFSRWLGKSLPLSDFAPILVNTETDLAILRGPPNWTGTLGVKGATFVTLDRLARAPLTHYKLKVHDGATRWTANSAQLIGSFEKWGTVLSNTTHGDSGAPYFCGKQIVGVHKGCMADQKNFNLMVPIPAIPGLTSTKQIFETTAPQGKVFSEELVKSLTKVYTALSHGDFAEAFRKAGKKHTWADLEDDDDYLDALAEKFLNEDDEIMVKIETSPGWGSTWQYVPDSAVYETFFAGRDIERAPIKSDIQWENESKPVSSTRSKNEERPAGDVKPSTQSPSVEEPSSTPTPSANDILQHIVNAMVGRIDVSEIKAAIVANVSGSLLSEQPETKQRRKRGSKGRKGKKPTQAAAVKTAENAGDEAKPMACETSVSASTGKAYVCPPLRPASNGAGGSTTDTTPNNSKTVSGGKNLPGNIPSWVRKQKVSGGPLKAQKPN